MTERGGTPETAGGLASACRLLLCTIFLTTGVAGLLAPTGFAVGLAQMGLPFPMAIALATIAINLLGPLVFILDIAGLRWAAAFALAAFTAVTIPAGHPFWRFAEPRRTEDMRIAIEHVSLIGALVLTGLPSLRAWREHHRRLPR